MIHRVLSCLAAAALLVLCGCASVEPLSDNPTDDQIEAQVISRLSADDLTQRFAFQASSEEGVVTLYGNVPGPHIRTQALAVTRGTPGVVRVVDYLSD